MKQTIVILAALAILTGCARSADLETTLDRLEFDDDQDGCLRFTGQIQVGGNPWAASSLNVSLVKKQGDDPGDC